MRIARIQLNFQFVDQDGEVGFSSDLFSDMIRGLPPGSRIVGVDGRYGVSQFGNHLIVQSPIFKEVHESQIIPTIDAWFSRKYDQNTGKYVDTFDKFNFGDALDSTLGCPHANTKDYIGLHFVEKVCTSCGKKV